MGGFDQFARLARTSRRELARRWEQLKAVAAILAAAFVGLLALVVLAASPVIAVLTVIGLNAWWG